ncbi:unnamed protein product [Caenorhabditis bovis]|uniref:Uncharacterized protein n=1 Tax=Caenorhabditis bovis TaxID=2654633 RepID=A0A8S1EP93_9PELO|nr:unnamed protein product [Caenorhabditis bovis]
MCYRIGSHLSGRFQIRENLVTEGFITQILAINLISSMITTGSSWILFHLQYESNTPFIAFCRNLFYLTPFNGFFVSIISIIQCAKRRERRNQKSASIVQLPAKGVEGYADMSDICLEVSLQFSKDFFFAQIAQFQLLEIAKYWPLQLILAFYTILAIISLFLSIYFIKTYIWMSAFHQSFKIFIAIYFTNIIQHQFCYTMSFAVFLKNLVQASTNKCDIILGIVPRTILHIPLSYSASVGVFTMFVKIAFYKPLQILFIVYTLFAIVTIVLIIYFLKVYIWKSTLHQSFKELVNIYFIVIFAQEYFYVFNIAVVLPCILIFWIYQNADFNQPAITILSIPGGVVERFSINLMGSIILLATDFIVLLYTHCYNRKLRKKRVQLRLLQNATFYRIGFNLSSRYQIMENMTTERFVTQILTVNLLLALLASSVPWILNNFELSISTDNIQFAFFLRSALFLSPVIGLLVSIISIWFMSRNRKLRIQHAAKMVKVPSRGRRGFQVYSKLLDEQWAQHFKKL